ncbi:MAG: hypothetical protein KKD63_15880 [Proteobacteria bacterium]|nr:hypothetical protein [Desulfobulbaceae bacterium]MBU4154348.1 hypothetical protein [Pseudomonadota bacterium]
MQSTDKDQNLVADFSLIELTKILIKNQGIHDGLYNLAVQFQFAVGAIGPSPDSICPGAMIGLSRIGLAKIEVEKENINTVNAATVNPEPKKRAKKTKDAS